MCIGSQKSEEEIYICDSCGRDFAIKIKEIVNPAQRQFCPKCLSPYLLDNED